MFNAYPALEESKKRKKIESEKTSKRIRCEENNENHVAPLQEASMGRCRSTSISSIFTEGSPIFGSILPDDLSDQDVAEIDAFELPEPISSSPPRLYVSTPSEAMFLSALERGFQSLAFSEQQADDSIVTRPRAGAFFHKPMAIRPLLLEIPVPVATQSDAMEVCTEETVGRRSQSPSSPV